MTARASLDHLRALSAELSEDEKEELAAELLADLYPSEEHEAAWRDEVERRLERAQGGDTQPVSWSDARAEIASRMRSRTRG